MDRAGPFPSAEKRSPNSMDRFLVVVIAVAVLCGCSIGKDYRRPDVDTPKSWHFEEKEAKAALNVKWWNNFRTPS